MTSFPPHRTGCDGAWCRRRSAVTGSRRHMPTGFGYSRWVRPSHQGAACSPSVLRGPADSPQMTMKCHGRNAIRVGQDWRRFQINPTPGALGLIPIRSSGMTSSPFSPVAYSLPVKCVRQGRTYVTLSRCVAKKDIPRRHLALIQQAGRLANFLVIPVALARLPHPEGVYGGARRPHQVIFRARSMPFLPGTPASPAAGQESSPCADASSEPIPAPVIRR